ncbi:MAG TPA: Ltp family lipoprotein [Nocardia sp.]|uniref:Ltp family lipoprotein n=1 Tax=Nocardia sp. TaxID=1821 RepID=UPI002B4AF840|nr:Ltp family lipoprotein [Nocardia sp.]HLS78486.1 Ltp family lipoprotein [Nocardia sp.]
MAVAPFMQQLSPGQQNAVRAAQQYLEISAFSRSGLIAQLEYEGYSTADATSAVDSLNVDWNEQAARSAKQYLEMTAFSRSGLIDQLVYEGFTYEQAEYGVNAAY